MRRLLILALLVLAGPAAAATLRFHFTTSPGNNTDPACPPAGGGSTVTDSVMVRWTASGPGLNVSDSLYLPRSVLVSKSYPVTGGTYTMTVTPARRSTTSGKWLAGCSATTTLSVPVDDVTAPEAIVILPN